MVFLPMVDLKINKIQDGRKLPKFKIKLCDAFFSMQSEYPGPCFEVTSNFPFIIVVVNGRGIGGQIINFYLVRGRKYTNAIILIESLLLPFIAIIIELCFR